jgi:H+-transporting ATPase
MAPLNEVENGNAEKEIGHDPQAQQAVANNDDDQGEYGNLVRYISQYRDGRRASTIGGDDDQPKKKHWWSRRTAGASGEGFETPDDWLNTDIKQGLKSSEVEQRRKKTGWNELTTEKENMFLKFLSYFTGPILYGALEPRAATREHPSPQLALLLTPRSHGIGCPPRCRSS